MGAGRWAEWLHAELRHRGAGDRSSPRVGPGRQRHGQLLYDRVRPASQSSQEPGATLMRPFTLPRFVLRCSAVFCFSLTFLSVFYVCLFVFPIGPGAAAVFTGTVPHQRGRRRGAGRALRRQGPAVTSALSILGRFRCKRPP